MEEIDIMAFWDELEKIGQEARSPASSFASKTVGAARAKLPEVQRANAPTTPKNLSPKLVGPASAYGQRQNYSQPMVDTTPPANPTMSAEARTTPPPNVVFGVR